MDQVDFVKWLLYENIATKLKYGSLHVMGCKEIISDI